MIKLFLCGLSYGFSLSYIYFLPLSIISILIFLNSIFEKNQIMGIFFKGWIFGIGFFVGSMHWIVSPMLIYEKHFFYAPLVSIIFPILMGLFFSAITFIIFFLKKFIDFKNKDFLFSKALLISLIFFLSEVSRSTMFGGLPFNLNAHIFAFETNLSNLSEFIGVFGLSFLTIYWFVNSAIFILFKNYKTLFLFLVIPIILNFSKFLNYQEITKSDNFINVKIIQPNIPQKEKWDRSRFQNNLKLLIDLSLKELPDGEILIIWPEVAITAFLNEEIEVLNYIRKKLPTNVTLITGALRRTFSNESYKVFNSLYIINNNRLDFYDKRRLVPFGEFVPLKEILSLIKITPGMSDFSIGKKNSLISGKIEGNNFKFESSICFEAIFQTFLSERIDFIVNLTNDAWFGATTGPRQHLASAIFRSKEKSTPMLRAANSGISVITDYKGRIKDKLDLNVRGVIESKVFLGSKKTIFSKYRNWTVFSLIILMTLFLFILDLFMLRIVRKTNRL